MTSQGANPVFIHNVKLATGGTFRSAHPAAPAAAHKIRRRSRPARQGAPLFIVSTLELLPWRGNSGPLELSSEATRATLHCRSVVNFLVLRAASPFSLTVREEEGPSQARLVWGDRGRPTLDQSCQLVRIPFSKYM